MALGVALHLGCDPIAIIGQDLALVDGASHTAQVDAGGKVEVNTHGNIEWKVNDPRCKVLSDGAGVHSMGSAVYIPGYHGKSVLTNTGLASFVTTFEGMALSYKDSRTLINATEGGARIDHMRPMYLQDVYDKYIKDQPDIDRSKLEDLCRPLDNAEDLRSEVAEAIQRGIDNLIKIKQESRIALDLCKVIKEGGQDKKTLETLLNRQSKHASNAQKLTNKIPAMRLTMLGAQRALADRRYRSGTGTKAVTASDLINDDELRAKKIERGSMILKHAIKTTSGLLPRYRKALNEIRNGWDIPEDRPPSIEDAEKYFNDGNFTVPLIDAERMLWNGGTLTPEAAEVRDRALSMRAEAIEKARQIQASDRKDNLYAVPLYYYLLSEIQRAFRDDEDDEKAFKLIEEAENLLPKRHEARWAHATLFFIQGKFEEARDLYRMLTTENENIPAYWFEYGKCLIACEQVVEGLDAIDRAVEMTDEYNWFLKYAAIESKKHDISRARDYAERYHKLFPQDSFTI
jgi:tetratricopeptide (TPR) repeat protein